MPNFTVKIHIVPGVDSRAAARDLLRNGAIGIDDIGEESYESIVDEIMEELGHAADGLDLRTERLDTAFGPVFVVRNTALRSRDAVKTAVLAARGKR